MCYDGDDGRSDVWDEALVKARKQHRCSECHRAIPPGRHYVRIGSLYEGSWETIRMHAECLALANFVRLKICEAEGEHGFIAIGGLGEEISSLDSNYGRQRMNESDLADWLAMGFEVECDDDCDAPTGSYQAICDWLWSAIKAEYALPTKEVA